MRISHSTRRAFSLVEVTVALGITAFCLLALFGLLPIGIAGNQASVTQSGAANIATLLIADLQATPIVAGQPQKSLQYKINIPVGAGSEKHTIFLRTDGKQVGDTDSDAKATLSPFYRAMVEVGNEPNSNGKATKVRMLVTWPALGDSTANATPKNFTGSFETVTFLNRN